MEELPVLFGTQGTLLGVLTTPGSVPAAAVACVMFNMGAYHRIGPRRVNVKLARALAAQGVSSIRFDLAGMGDSGAPNGAEHFEAQAVQDLKAAMNLVETTLGIRRFLIIGLCSGAGSGLALAEEDPRVVGLLMMDGYTFPNAATLRARTWCRLMAMTHNPAILGKTVRWLQRKIRHRAAAAGNTPQLFTPEPPEVVKSRFRKAMITLAQRNVAVLCVYTGTLHARDTGRDQWGALANEPFMQKMEYRFFGEMDHTFISVEGQHLYVADTCAWVLRVADAKSATGTALSAPGHDDGSTGDGVLLAHATQSSSAASDAPH